MHDAGLSHGAYYICVVSMSNGIAAAFRTVMAGTRTVCFRGLEMLGRGAVAPVAT